MRARWWDPGIAKGDRHVMGFGNSRDLRGFNRGDSQNLYGMVRIDWSRGKNPKWRLDMAAFMGDTILILMGSYGYQGLKVLWLTMTQGQLLGSMGESRSGEGTRKRLKISVPHFDNSALIKSCSKMLIGRCMNPEKQEMKALLTKLPKIWNLEDKVVGTDLGLGKFQFEFEKEEDIEGVLKHQPYHFDYWMIALGKWQPKKSLHYPSEIPWESGSLCHGEENCPTVRGAQQNRVKQTENRGGNGGWHEAGTHDERARSYKGVVINGNGGH
ncbi:hypothetical protein Rs2_37496 [Raphanus sativus]|nr:hypothetical protein Rs2_37496 [Raphanus sativus]